MEHFYKFDILVIGAGHAGIEASNISALMGKKVGLVTLEGLPIGETPCNPAIGGVGKGQIVREIDILGGLISKIADESAIHYRTLNESKGYAVRSTRVQIDKRQYSNVAERLLRENDRITIIRDKVVSVSGDDGFYKVNCLKTNITSKKIIFCSGTFLNGLMHTGKDKTIGGVVGYDSSPSLYEIFRDNTIETKRFKTGTPPRLNHQKINYEKLVEQKSDGQTQNFHIGNKTNTRNSSQISCFITNTNSKTLSIIRKNRSRAPMFNGQIQGVGPRYCPSIEDKAYRYEDRDEHHIFIEREGVETNYIYPNGVSTSLPRDVQDEFIRSIAGLENSEILEYGYAVEYDVINSIFLKETLEFKKKRGVYFAGQVNGSSGYEEAAAQGIVAGINASLSLKGEKEMIFDRSESYIGVLIGDMVSNERDEPYRLFTARSENRLYIREDNSYVRMSKYRWNLEIGNEHDRLLTVLMNQFQSLSTICDSTFYGDNKKNRAIFLAQGYGNIHERTSLTEILKKSNLDPVEILTKELERVGFNFDKRVIQTVAISKKYEGYIKRSDKESARVKKLECKKINIDELLKAKCISNECRQRIKRIRPLTFGQLKKINGIRPATLVYIAGLISSE